MCICARNLFCFWKCQILKKTEFCGNSGISYVRRPKNKPSDIKACYVRRLTRPSDINACYVQRCSVEPSDIKRCGSHIRQVKRLGTVMSDGRLRPSEVHYVRRQPSDITLFPTRYVRWLETVEHNRKPSDISYVQRLWPYIRRLWPSEGT
jgi:hypothetical protein